MIKRYTTGRDRALKDTIRRTKKYKSRRELHNDYRVRSAVNKWRRKGLGELEPEFIEDKYYVPEHFPAHDIATEMGSYGEFTKSKVVKIALTVAAGYILFRLVNP